MAESRPPRAAARCAACCANALRWACDGPPRRVSFTTLWLHIPATRRALLFKRAQRHCSGSAAAEYGTPRNRAERGRGMIGCEITYYNIRWRLPERWPRQPVLRILKGLLGVSAYCTGIRVCISGARGVQRPATRSGVVSRCYMGCHEAVSALSSRHTRTDSAILRTILVQPLRCSRACPPLRASARTAAPSGAPLTKGVRRPSQRAGRSACW